MRNIKRFKDYDPSGEYKSDSRRELNLDSIRKSTDYKKLLSLGFEEETSHQQELNNTLKFIRVENKKSERGHSDVFYTVHPSGTVRRYNPVKSKDVPEGNGNDIKKFGEPFKTASDYKKGIKYLYNYLERKEERGDYR